MSESQNGKFRQRRVNFSAISNSALEDNRLSLKSKGLYAFIQSYIGKPNFTLYKRTLIAKCKEGPKAFDSAWKELKDTGYLKIYRIPSGENDKFEYQYELLDEPDMQTAALINLKKDGEVIPIKENKEEKGSEKSDNRHTPQKGGYADFETDKRDISHTPHFAPYANRTICEPHHMPNGGSIRNTETRKTEINNNIKSVSQSKEKIEDEIGIDGQTDLIRKSLKSQIDYDYFEDNFPEDLPGINALIDCMTQMSLVPKTKINGIKQDRRAVKSYIDNVDSETVSGFIEHMRGKKMRDVKNISAYWQTAFINFIREQELTRLTI